MRDLNVIPVMIVSDHAMLRQGVEFALKPYPEVELVAVAHSSRESIQLYPLTHPHVVLVDALMLDADGLDAIRLLRRLNKQITIIAFTYFSDDPTLATEALLAGANHCICKQTPIPHIITLIRAS